MLKHATITRTNRAQQALQLQKQWENQILQLEQKQQSGDELTLSSIGSCQSSAHASGSFTSNHETIANESSSASQADNGSTYRPHDIDEDNVSSPDWLTNTLRSLQHQHNLSQSCSSSPTPSIVNQATPVNGQFKLSSAPSSVFSSPNKLNNGSVLTQCDDRSSSNRLFSSATTATTTTATKNCSESMIRIFAQILGQDLKYVTLHVNPQTKSSQIIRNLLKKFRLKHRDPNLFYLTLERWIRKDGLKFKSVMLLSDEACPLQLQQCCSNPPHDDIKFTLQTRAGALVKIHCSDVCPDVRYKCLSLSTQTSVDETIGLMLQCLNLVGTQQQQSDALGRTNSANARLRSLAGSPGSTTDSSSTSSSSSGIESDPTNHHHQQPAGRQLDSSSRTSSVTSISSSSNMSSSSAGNQLSEQYCLLIECKDTNYRRILESDEYLVDVYQNLLDEIRENQQPSSASESLSLSSSDISNHNNAISPNSSYDLSKQQPEQWFVIKLKRREEISQQPSIKFANPRQNMPLPPIPLSLAQHNANALKHIVTTTQIEVKPQNNNLNQRHQSGFNDNSHQRLHSKQRQHHSKPLMHFHWPSSSVSCLTTIPSKSAPVNGATPSSINGGTDTVDGLQCRNQEHQRAVNHQSATLELPRRNPSHHIKQLSAIAGEVATGNGGSAMPPPPKSLIWLPEVKPRRMNLSNMSSSTFGRPHANISNGIDFNRRRYDPAQLAEDLEKLDMSNGDEKTSEADEMTREQHSANATDPTTNQADLVKSGDGAELDRAEAAQ